MRVLFAFALLCVVGVLGGDKMYKEIKMWAKQKALESCLGEDVVKAHMIKIKKAAAKCTGKDAPELDLPFLENPYKLVSALTRKSSSRPQAGADFQKMLAGFLQLQMLEQFSDSSPRSLHKRASDTDDVYDLGERLQEKLKGKKEMMEEKMGMWTCMLQECGMLDGQGKFNLEKAKRDWKENGPKDEWLSGKLEWACDNCEEMANNIPKPFLDQSPFGPEMCKVKMFKECMMKMKFHTCMKFDMKKKLEKHFGSVEELQEQTGLEENELFMVVKELLKGPEEMMMM